MTGHHEDRVRQLFFAALDVPADDRAAFLAEQCRGNERLRERIAVLLSHDESAVGFMETPAVAGADTPRVPRDAQIGRYRIVRVIGTGGMGVVYEAEQDHPHRTVALKVMRHGAASRQAMRRFDHEVEILGRLQHPNIAHIHEAGTFDAGDGARPFFAMEYVRGRPLLAHVRIAKASVRDRLLLFVTICDAVQHAHQRGIIHRDLKPGNILIGDQGEPKILDFGVARATDSDIQTTTLETDIGQFIGTLAYMSPEQVAGDPRELDTRSDVYSLGVLLYELLANRLPHDLEDRSVPEAVRMIGDDDPPPLSSVSRLFRGDLDTIVAKALEKERDRRYQTASELAADIRHYLADEPIVARPASTFYQVRKFARRNRGLVAGVTAAFAILLVSLLVVAFQAERIGREAARTAENSAFFQTLLLKVHILGAEARPIGPAEVGVNLTLIDVLTEAIERLDEQPLSDQALEATFRYRTGRGFMAASRLYDSREQLERALQIRRDLFGETHPDTAQCKVALAQTLHWLPGEESRAKRLAQEAVAAYEAQAVATDERFLDAMRTLVGIQVFGGDPEAGIRTARRVVDILDTSDRPIDIGSFVPKAQIAGALCLLDRPDEASPWLEQARADLQAQTGGEHPARSLIDEIQGMLAVRRGRWEEAARAFDRARKCDAIYRGEGTYLAAESLMVRQMAEVWRGRWGESAAIMRDILQSAELSMGRENAVTATTANDLAFRLMRADELDEAETAYRYCASILERLEVSARPHPDWTRYWFARVLAANGKTREAAGQFRRALEIASRQRGRDHELTLRAGNELARVLWKQRRLAEAEPIARASVAGYRRTREKADPSMLYAAHTLACILRDLGDVEAAKSLFEEIESAPRDLERSRGELDDRWYFPHDAECLLEIGRPKEAEAVLLAIQPPAADVLAYLVRLYEAEGALNKAAECRELLANAKDGS